MKQFSKKALSVLLSVIMVVSTVSVCFGSIVWNTAPVAEAANASKNTYDEDPLDYLSKALKSDTIQWIADNYNIGNTTNTGNASNSNNIVITTDISLPTYEEYIEVRDILIYLDMAIKGTKEWATAESNNTDYKTRACTSPTFIETELLDALGNVSNAGKEFISYVLEDSKATAHSNAQGSVISSGEKKVPASHTVTLNIHTTDIKGYLKEVGEYTNVDSSVELGYTYKIVMDRGYYQDGTLKTKKWHNYIKGINYGGTSSTAPSEITGKANTSIKTTVNNYAAKIDNMISIYTFDVLAGLGLSGIEAAVKELTDARTAIKEVVNRNNLDNYSTLFPGYDAKIAAFEETAEKAKAIAGYVETVKEITAFQQAHKNDYGTFQWGAFDEATIKADYAEFMGKYGSIINDATLYEYFVNVGSISDAEYNNFRDNVVAYDLEDLKEEKVIPLYDKYALSFPMEGGEDIPLAEKQDAYSTLSGYIKNIKSYSNQVQNAIFPESLNAYLDLQEKLECQVADCVVYFAEHVGVDYSNVATADVIAELEAAKAQLAALNALKNSIDYADNNALLTGAFANADEFITYLYELLGSRYTAQVNAANDVYDAINRPSSSLTIEQYSKLNALVKGIEDDIVTYLDGEGKGTLVTQETRNIRAALTTELMPAFNAFEIDRGFTNYTAQDIIIRREDSAEEFFRENANLDDDLYGEYEVTDDNVNAIVELLEALLKDETISKLLGDLINKDENGNPTGKAFSLASLITSLLDESVFTDELLNTIIQFVYPLVLKEFAKVWAGLPATINIITQVTVGVTVDVDVDCGLALDDVETAIKSVGLFIGPKALASNLSNNFSQYSQVIKKLNEVSIKAQYNKEKDTFRNPWEDEVLFKTVVADDGTEKQVYDLNWGINEATDKRKAFIDAAVAALSGLEPLLMALISNKDFTNPDVTDTGNCRGVKIGTGGGVASVGITLNITIDPITLTLTFDKNDGWDNALVPIFEALGLTNIPHSEDLQTTRTLLENGLFATIDQLIAKLDSNPIQFLLNALPNLAYMLEAGMIEPLLHEVKTVINYYADAYYNAGNLAKDTMLNAMKSEEPININIGEMINLKDMGLDISNFAAIWNMIAGGVELLAGVEAPDAAFIASLGQLVPAKTNRSVRTYTATTSNGKTLAADEAWYIKADTAAVLEYLIQWVLGSGLLNGIVENPEGIVATIFENLENSPNDVIAAVVELLNQKAYPSKEYEWFYGTINGESVVGNSANEIYLNPGNDWTKDKAQYLYENIDAILNAVLTMAGVDFDLGATISDAVNGLLTDKTLTALAGLLAKLDLNALLAGEEETETVAEGEAAPALDVNALVKQYLGIDLAAIAAQYAPIAAELEANPEYVYDFGVDAGTTTFAAALAEMLDPLSVVLAFILDGGNLTLTVDAENKVTLLGGNGYNDAIVPLLEALGCTIPEEGTSLEKTINALVGKVNEITSGDVIKNIIDLLPGVFYFIASNGLSTAVLNLLKPVLVIVDTIRPVIDVMDIINGLEIGDEDAKQTLAEFLGGELNLKNLNLDFIFYILPVLVPAIAALDLSELKDVIYDICYNANEEYTSVSTLQTSWKRGAYTEKFSQADLLTVVLSFVLEWATVADNAAALDEMLGTEGIIAGLGKVFDDLEISYGTPDWGYWFADEAAFEAYLSNRESLETTLHALTYPNDWSDESATYIAENLADLADMVVALIEIDGVKYESVSALLNSLVYGDLDITVSEANEETGDEAIVINYLFSDETINALIGLLNGVLANIDEALLGAGYILDVDVVGLKNYVCTEDITTIEGFFEELANILDTYAKGLVDVLFFGDDFRLAKKSDKTDTIVINGGLGYEKGLALILEALGCDVPAADEATTENVLGCLADRIEAILANPVEEVIDLLPNIVYFLNANGAGVAVDNILQPVYRILDKLTVFGVELDLADLLGFNLKYLSLADILALVEDMTELDLEEAEEILVDFCYGDIKEAKYGYKMIADRKDTITIILTTALVLVSDEDFAAKLDEMLGIEVVSALKTVFESAPVTYKVVEWYALDESDIDYDNATVGVIKHAITYPNNWTEESAQYVAENLVAIGDLVAGLIDSNYDSLSALLGDKVNIYTPETLEAIQKLLGDLIGGLDADLADLVNVGLGAADKLLDADVNALLNYDVSDVKDKETFVAALTGMLMEVEGLLDWLLFGEDYKFFVNNDKDDIITLNGGYGYAEGLAIVLEALGVENLPDVYTMEEIDTEAVVSAVLTATFDRFDAILANPVEEVFNLLPNVLYFINANGLTVAVNNLLGSINALLIKLEGLGVELDIAALVNFSDILGVETDLALDNISMEAIVALVAELTGLNLDNIAEVLVGFALGRVQVYESVSKELAYKMYYHNDFAKHDMITTLATVAIITLTDEANAEKVKELLGENIYELVLNLCNLGEVKVQDFDWKFTDRADTDEVFSALASSDLYQNHHYGPLYTEDMAQYVSDNFGEFVDNIVYLLGISIEGQSVDSLKELINGLLGGSLYNSENVVAIRDALAGILAGVTELKVEDAVVGGYIAEILKTAGIADIAAVANVEVPEFTNDRAQFVEYLCKVLEPLYGVLKFVLANEDITFFVNKEKTDAIGLKGAEGYAYGIIPLLEVFECENILTPDEYYAAVEADGNVLLTSILNPLLDRVDAILAEDPAQEILDMLPNLIYFINSNGVDTVVKNTLAAVFELLSKIKPIAEIDLYEIIGIDLATIDFDWLFNKALELIADATGYEFTALDASAIAELTVGKLESYTSANGNTAYKMVYTDETLSAGGKAEMATVIMRLLITFIMHENNQEMLIGLLTDTFSMTPDAEKYLRGVIGLYAEVAVDTRLGMDQALATTYYLFYGADTGVDNVTGGYKDINAAWREALESLKKENGMAAELIEALLGFDIFDDLLDVENGIAPNGFLAFFAKITELFNKIIEWFKGLFA